MMLGPCLHRNRHLGRLHEFLFPEEGELAGDNALNIAQEKRLVNENSASVMFPYGTRGRCTSLFVISRNHLRMSKKSDERNAAEDVAAERRDEKMIEEGGPRFGA